MARLISFLQDLFIRKLGPPVIGAFVAAWTMLNWEHVALLLWSNDSLEVRVTAFKLALDQGWRRKYFIPATIASMYLLLLPYISLGISTLQIHAKRKMHEHRVKAEIASLKKNRELNVELVLADPNKNFIEELAQQKIEREKAELERQQAENKKLQADAEIAQSEAIRKKSEEADNEAKLKRAEVEKLKLESAQQIQKATIASNRFPAAYSVISFLHEALQADGIDLKFEQITSIIAVLFGYKNFEELVNDPQFNNDIVSKLLGVFYDADELSRQIYNALGHNPSAFDGFEPALLYDYFNEHPHLKLLTQESLDEYAQSLVEDIQYTLFDHTEVANRMAETNTIYEEVTEIVFETSGFDEHGYTAVFSVTIEGYERQEDSVRGLPLSVTVNIHASLLLGSKGLGVLELGDVSAEIVWPR